MTRSLYNVISPLTHLLAGLLTPTWFYAYTQTPADWRIYTASLFFAILPDIDSHASFIGRAFPFIAQPLESRFGHRQITHSLFSLALVSILSALLFKSDWWFYSAAYASHLIIDMLTGNLGVPLLWPFQVRFYLLKIPPKSINELFLAICIAVLLLLPQAAQTRAAVAALIPQEELILDPTPTPTPTATPQTVRISIPNVYNIGEEILVKPGDGITQGDLLADLITYRLANVPSPTPAPSHTPKPQSTPTLIPITTADPLRIAAIEQDLELARSIYHRSVATGTPNPIYVATAASFPPQIQDRQDCIAREGQHSEVGWRCRQDLEQLSQQATRISDLAAPRPVDPLDAQVAYVRFKDAEIIYQQAIIALTPSSQQTIKPTNTPTLPPPTQTLIPTLPSEDTTRIRSLVDGTVLEVKISRITSNYATVEIIIDITNDHHNPAHSSPSTRPPQNNLFPALVTHVRDGDTIEVLFFDGAKAAVRLISIDTPETVHPNQPVECYGEEASTFTKQTLLNQLVYLEPDPQKTERDRYGRLLAHIWLDAEQTRNFSLMLLEQGYARYDDFGEPGIYADEYRESAEYARESLIGLWATCSISADE